MKRVLLVATILVLSFGLTGGASAGWLFAQDDFWIDMPNGEGSAGQEMYADGRLLSWDARQIVGFFELTGTNTSAAADTGDQWYTVYDVSTLKIWSAPFKTDLLWEGDGYITTSVNKDGSPFFASDYDRPDYETEPTEFMGVGDGWFDYDDGLWSSWPAMDVEWLGTYNWSYFGDPPTYMIGNAQGKLTPIPEPGSMLVLGTGLAGLMGFVRRRRS